MIKCDFDNIDFRFFINHFMSIYQNIQNRTYRNVTCISICRKNDTRDKFEVLMRLQEASRQWYFKQYYILIISYIYFGLCIYNLISFSHQQWYCLLANIIFCLNPVFTSKENAILMCFKQSLNTQFPVFLTL